MATDAITYKMDGLADLEKQLLKLEQKASSKVLRRALAKAARPVVKHAKSLAPKRTGALALSIGYATRKGRGSNVATVFVGPKVKNKRAIALANTMRSKPIKGIFYGHLVELGYGRQRPEPFMRPALDAQAFRATNEFAVEVKTGLEDVARKGNT